MDIIEISKDKPTYVGSVPYYKEVEDSLKKLEERLKHTINRNHWKSGPIVKRRHQ